MNYTESIELTKLTGVVRQNGWTCIPDTSLNIWNERAFLTLDVREMQDNAYGKSHFVKQHVGKEVWDTLSP